MDAFLGQRPEKLSPASAVFTVAWVWCRHVMVSDEEVLKSFLRGVVAMEVSSAERSLVNDWAPSCGEVLC